MRSPGAACAGATFWPTLYCSPEDRGNFTPTPANEYTMRPDASNPTTLGATGAAGVVPRPSRPGNRPGEAGLAGARTGPGVPGRAGFAAATVASRTTPRVGPLESPPP